MYRDDLQKSMARFELVRPHLDRMLGGRTKAVEGSEDEICLILDRSCGTDYLHERKDIVWGIAARIQNYPNMRTFTVRKERESGAMTEWEKRRFAIEHGGIYPYLTMQAYVQNEKLVGMAVCRTEDLIEFVDGGYAFTTHTRQDKIGQASFFVCKWDEMTRRGFTVREWRTV